MEINIIDILLHAANVVILYFFMRWLLYKPVNKFLKQREDIIEKRIKDAEEKEAMAVAKNAEYEELLDKAHVEAAEIIRRSSDLAKDHSKEIIDAAEAQAKDMIERANKDIENKKNQEKENMKREITDMAVQIAGKVLEREISHDDNKRIIDDFFTKVG